MHFWHERGGIRYLRDSVSRLRGAVIGREPVFALAS